jgi:hypothetical protein
MGRHKYVAIPTIARIYHGSLIDERAAEHSFPFHLRQQEAVLREAASRN